MIGSGHVTGAAFYEQHLGPALSLHACAAMRSENTHGKPSSPSSAGLELATRSLPSRSEEQRDRLGGVSVLKMLQKFARVRQVVRP